MPNLQLSITRGQTAYVSLADVWVFDHKWQAHPDRNTTYVCRGIWLPDKKRMKTLRLHREIMKRVLDRPLESWELVDHRNGNGLENVRENLRLATRSVNRKNHQRARDGKNGVSFDSTTGRWRVRATDGSRKSYGLFSTEAEALQKAREMAA